MSCDSEDNLVLGVVGDLCEDSEILQAARILGLKYKLIPDVREHHCEEDVYVVPSFDSTQYKTLRHLKINKIIGPPVLLSNAATNRLGFEPPSKPVYCLAMDGAVVCVSGIYEESEWNQLMSYAIKMGARVRSEVTLQCTHLVSATTYSEKYRLAVNFGCEILSTEWIYQSWAQKDEHLFSATDKSFVTKYKLAPFYYCKLAIYGFVKQEADHMQEIAVENGAQIVDPDAADCEVLVIDDARISALPENLVSDKASIAFVRAEWFWVSVQMQVFARPEQFPYIDKVGTPLLQKAKTPRSEGVNNSNSKKTKRRRLQDNLTLLAQDNASPVSSMVANFEEANAGSIIIDSPDCSSEKCDKKAVPITPKSFYKNDDTIETSTPDKFLVPKTKRHEIVMELYQTETNYLTILQTIIKEFKEQLESEEAVGNSLIDPEKRKIIFDRIPNLYAVHSKIQSKLFSSVTNWKEDISIGKIFLDAADDLQKTYPPFVNFFEIAKETLEECDRTKPRFHAFLKVRATKPECGRQTLSDLFIRPVQRLPSILLLMTDLLKKTDSAHCDHSPLEEALEKLKRVTSHINEDKRKTESRLEMLNIATTIENIPATIISSHRQLIISVDATEVTDQITYRQEQLCLFLFSDCLLVAKKRHRALKSPATKTPQQKSYKYQAVINLGQVKRVVDVECNTNLPPSVFGVVFKPQSETCETLFAFSLSEEYCKSDFIKKLAEQTSITQMRTDSENLITIMPASELNLDGVDAVNTSLTKAISKVAKKTSMKVSQALTGSAGKSAPGKENYCQTSILQKGSSDMSVDGVSTTPIRSSSRGFMFSKKLMSTLDLTSVPNSSREDKMEYRKRTLPDRSSTMAESSVSLSRNNFR